MKAILLIIALTSLASCGGGGGGGGTPVLPKLESKVSNVKFDIADSSIVPNEDLVVKGTCKSSKSGEDFEISVNEENFPAKCIDGKFEILIPASEVPPGVLKIAAVGDSKPTPVSITKTKCNLNQDLVANSCVDRPIQNAELLVTSTVADVTGVRFIPSVMLTLSSGNTAEARRIYLFQDSSLCGSFLTNNCHVSSTSSACKAIASSNAKPSSSIDHTIAGLTNGQSAEVAALYVNGSEVSTCLSHELSLDSVAPEATISLDRAVINNPALHEMP